jgi:hypothetical protein
MATMHVVRRILLAGLVSWLFTVTLGLLFAISMSGHFQPAALRLPGVIPVALTISTTVAIGITPIGVWAARTGRRNLWLLAPALWLLLAAYIVVVIPRVGSAAIYALIPLAVIGLVIVGFIPPRGATAAAERADRADG